MGLGSELEKVLEKAKSWNVGENKKLFAQWRVWCLLGFGLRWGNFRVGRLTSFGGLFSVDSLVWTQVAIGHRLLELSPWLTWLW